MYVETGSCEISFNPDSMYLVYGYLNFHFRYPYYKLETDICTRTKLLSKAKNDIDSLGRGIIHYRVENEIDEKSSSLKDYLLYVSIILNFILIGFIFIRRNSKSTSY